MNIRKNGLVNCDVMDGTETQLQKLLPVFLHNFGLLKNEFSFLVLLCSLESSLVLPAQHLTTVTTVYISNCVKASYEISVFFRPQCKIHCVREQEGSTISSLKSK